MERDQMEDLGVDWMIILKWKFKKWVAGIDRIDLVRDRGRWRALVKEIVNLRVP
jgi:hypothetical protein